MSEYKRPLGKYDPYTHTWEEFDYDPLTDETKIQTFQNVEPYLENNKQLQKDPDYKRQGIKNEMQHIATIPNVIILKWKREYGIDVFNKNDWPKVKALLQDPTWRYLRTTLGGI